jgi:hypothetical protein
MRAANELRECVDESAAIFLVWKICPQQTQIVQVAVRSARPLEQELGAPCCLTRSGRYRSPLYWSRGDFLENGELAVNRFIAIMPRVKPAPP